MPREFAAGDRGAVARATARPAARGPALGRPGERRPPRLPGAAPRRVAAPPRRHLPRRARSRPRDIRCVARSPHWRAAAPPGARSSRRRSARPRSRPSSSTSSARRRPPSSSPSRSAAPKAIRSSSSTSSRTCATAAPSSASATACFLHRSLASMDRLVPEGIVALLRDKVDRLEAEDRRLLGAASVEGLEFSAAVAARLVERDEAEVEERLRRLEVGAPDGRGDRRARAPGRPGDAALPIRPLALSARLLRRARAVAPRGPPPRRGARDRAPVRRPARTGARRARGALREGSRFHGARSPSSWPPPRRRPGGTRATPARSSSMRSSLRRSCRRASAAARRAELLVRIARHEAETAEFAGDVALYDRAERAVSEALTLEPDSVDARTVLGLIHLERGENESRLRRLRARARVSTPRTPRPGTACRTCSRTPDSGRLRSPPRSAPPRSIRASRARSADSRC